MSVCTLSTTAIARRTSLWLRRAAAVLAIVSAGLHAAALGDHVSSPMLGALAVAMIVGCLYCARHLWISGSTGDWCLVAIMNVGMIAVHTTMLSPGSGGGSHHGQAHMAAASAGHSMSTLMTVALAAATVETVLAVSVLFHKTRLDIHHLDVNHRAQLVKSIGGQ